MECQVCLKMYANEACLEIHVEAHHEDSIYCILCDETLNGLDIDKIYAHQNAHNNKDLNSLFKSYISKVNPTKCTKLSRHIAKQFEVEAPVVNRNFEDAINDIQERISILNDFCELCTDETLPSDVLANMYDVVYNLADMMEFNPPKELSIKKFKKLCKKYC